MTFSHRRTNVYKKTAFLVFKRNLLIWCLSLEARRANRPCKIIVWPIMVQIRKSLSWIIQQLRSQRGQTLISTKTFLMTNTALDKTESLDRCSRKILHWPSAVTTHIRTHARLSKRATLSSAALTSRRVEPIRTSRSPQKCQNTFNRSNQRPTNSIECLYPNK